jgi:hypothetical protein
MICGVFVRFVVGSDGQHHKELTGIITEARLLRDRGELTTDEDDLLEALYEWFNDHVPVPPLESRRFPRDAVPWFRDDAGKPVAKMWDIVALLQEHGVDVRLLRSANPGRVVYEDRVQVLVDEWNRL